MLFRIIIAALIYSSAESTHIKATFPPPNSTTFPRLRLDATLPNLQELTFCSWVKWVKNRHIRPLHLHLHSLFSYATLQDDNEFGVALFVRNGKATPQVIGGNKVTEVDCEVDCEMGTWCHMCVTWFGASGRLNTFIDGKKCKEESTNESYVRSGGVLVLGQDQVGLDFKYNFRHAFTGDIADFQLWSEVLSEDQIKEAGVCRGKRKEGNVVSWLKTPMVALDGVILSSTQLCLP